MNIWKIEADTVDKKAALIQGLLRVPEGANGHDWAERLAEDLLQEDDTQIGEVVAQVFDESIDAFIEATEAHNE